MVLGDAPASQWSTCEVRRDGADNWKVVPRAAPCVTGVKYVGVLGRWGMKVVLMRCTSQYMYAKQQQHLSWAHRFMARDALCQTPLKVTVTNLAQYGVAIALLRKARSIEGKAKGVSRMYMFTPPKVCFRIKHL